MNILKNNYIPGNNNIEDFHIYTLIEIENHFNSYLTEKGCYVCSCGYYYSIDGFPTEEQFSNCPNCKKIIGYIKIENLKNEKKYILSPREGHYRIFKNFDEKKNEMSKYGITDEIVPSKTFEEYITDVINPILMKEKKGLNIISKNSFLLSCEKIRNLSKIGYRLLNFIIYNHLFFANCLGYISNEELKQYCLIKDMQCIEIIEENWNLLQEALHEETIQSIEVFMNLIIPKLSRLINESKSFKDIKERNKFEDDVEKEIKESLKNYNEYKEKYIEKNLSQLNMNKNSLKIILNEMIETEKYEEDKYPFFKYFRFTQYSNKNIFEKFYRKNEEKYKYKYPLLNEILQNNENKNKIKNLIKINEFCNYMIDHYSLKISRIEANNAILKKYENEQENNQLKDFISSWNNIYKDANLYNGKEVEQKSLSSNDKIIHFLNDKNDKHIAAAYQLFISWQNEFLKHIYDANIHNGILQFYANCFKNRIPIQKAKDNHILSFDKIDLEEIISKNKKRDIFKNNNTIYYLNYNSFIYDLDNIEKELGEIILPGKCFFEENKLKYFTFCYENDSDIFTTFSENYEQEKLSEEEIKLISGYFKDKKEKLIIEDNNDDDKSEDDNDEREQNDDFRQILNSIKSIINYLNNYNHDSEDTIKAIIVEMNDKFEVKKELKDFFVNDGEKFKVNILVNLYLYLEEFFFNNIINRLYKENKLEDMDEDKYTDINSKLNEFSDKIYLVTALRRFMSRYYIREINSNKSEENLASFLSKPEFWEIPENKYNSIIEQLKKLNIKLSESFFVYELINDDNQN